MGLCDWRWATALLAAALAAEGGLAQVSVRIEADRSEVGMGRVVAVTATVSDAAGMPIEGARVLPYVDGRRWGAHEFTDSEGKAITRIPLPNVGAREIVVEANPPTEAPPERWIWAQATADNQAVRLQKTFDLPARPKRALLRAAVDDGATFHLNGERIGDFGGWKDILPIVGVERFLREGENVLSVEGRNGTGPAGLLLRLEMETDAGPALVASDASWRSFGQAPAGWPGAAAGGEAVSALGDPSIQPWRTSLGEWPGLEAEPRLFAGMELPAGAIVSNAVQVEVTPRELAYLPSDPDHLVGMQWEPWFTPLACDWGTAQAVPLMGFYWSVNPDVTRQHMIWLMESGVDFLIVDWTNHIWGREHWDERPEGSQSIIDATTAALDVLAEMRDEGCRVPKMVLYPGLNNGPTTTMTAVNEELEWIHQTYVLNRRYHDLFLEYLGKPLVLIHNGAGPDYVAAQDVKIDDTHFTVRWHSSQNQMTDFEERGYWSWMDGVLDLPVTYFEGEPECLTVSTAFFASGGWLYPGAYGHLGGWTYLETFKSALRHRPRFIEVHQFNEFAGQPEGQGYGENRDIYVDSYSVELSDDIEPVSLTTPAYRGDGGWGFLYLNQTRALIDLYRQETPETTVLAIRAPLRGQVVTGGTLEVEWNWVGVEPESFTIEVDGKTAALTGREAGATEVGGLQGKKATIDLSGVPAGTATLRLIANGAAQRYRLSCTEDSLPLAELEPAWAEVEFERG